jgi:hypothetical protein
VNVSPEIARRLQHAHEQEKLYRPSENLQRELGVRSLVMVVAPAAMGKSYVMRLASEIDPQFGRSSIVSTRDLRDDDEPALFRLLPHDDENISDLLDRVDSHEMVQYAIHPTEGTFYGTELEDYPFKHNMLATLSTAVDQLQHVGFGNTTLIGLVSPPGDWLERFDARYGYNHPKRLRRLKEAHGSFTDLLKRDDVHWIINSQGEGEQAAKELIEATENPVDQNDEAVAYARRIIQRIEDVYKSTYVEKDD